MFATLKFRNEFCFVQPGLQPQILNTGSTGGTAIPVACLNTTSAGASGNYLDLKKWVAIVQTGSGSTNTLWNAWWGGASASGGTFSMLPASSTSTFSASQTYGNSAQYASAATLVMEIRGEYISGLGSNVTWIKPIVSLSNASAYGACLSLGFDSGISPASFGDYNPAVNGSSQFVLQETDSF